MRGCIKESKYNILDDIVQHSLTKFQLENQVSYMNNSQVLHRISNPNPHGAVTLHIYHPPFSQCKVWSNLKVNGFDIAKMGFFSYKGKRTPHLEGKPGYHSKLMSEINSINTGDGI